MMAKQAVKRVSLDTAAYYRMISNFRVAIESRVARIKARVAELTGGMDGAAPRR